MKSISRILDAAMRSRYRLGTIAVMVVLSHFAILGTSVAQTVSFTTTRVPTSALFDTLEIRSATAITGMNDSGQFVGTFGERNWVIWGMPHAFIYGSTGYGLLSGAGSYGRDPTGQYRLGEIEGPRYYDPKYHYLDLAPASNSDFNQRVTTPYAINNAGLVVGKIAADEYGTNPSVGFRYDSMTV